MFKKIISVFASAVMLLTVFDISAAVFAEPAEPQTGSCGGNVTYTLSDNDGDGHYDKLVISGMGDMTDYDDNYNDRPYMPEKRKFDNKAYCNDFITEIIVEDGVTSIGNYAFAYFKAVNRVTIPNTVSTIGKYAFRNCSSLYSIELPEGVKTLLKGAFMYCTALKNVKLPDTLENICIEAFNGCIELNEITIPRNIQALPDYTFSYCECLTQIILPCSSIGVNAIPETATQIKYEITADNKVKIIEIILGTNNNLAVIPDTIGGLEVEEIDKELMKSVDHTHVDEISATCTSKAVCGLCGEYGEEPAGHNYVDGVCSVCGDVPVPFDYKEVNGEIQIRGYKGSDRDVIIPETIDGKPVTIIYEIRSDDITSVTIPKTVDLIYGAAFLTPYLKEIRFDELYDGLLVIGANAFPDTLEKVVLPANMTEKDVKGKLILDSFPENAVIYSGSEPLPHSYKLTAGTMGNGHDGEHYLICEVCGYIDPNSYEEHLPQGEFLDGDKPETHHYRKCKCGLGMSELHVWDDGTVTTEPTETDNGVKLYTCTVCGKEKTELIDMHIHSFVSHPAVIPTCTTDGNEAYRTCSGCSKMFFGDNGAAEIDAVPIIPALGHAASAGWENDSGSHWHICGACGERFDTATHVSDSGTVTKEPTSTEPGIKTFRCTVCGMVIRTVTVTTSGEAHSHVYSTEWRFSDTRHWHECICGDKTDDTLHTPDSGTVTKQPTAYETGIRTYCCTVCGAFIFSETIPAAGINPDPSIPYIPSGSTVIPVISAQKEPFISDNSDLRGWDMIMTEINAAPDGSTININMNGTFELPKNIVSDIAGRDIYLVLDMGSYTWTVNGMSITKAKAVDMRIRKVSKIPGSAVRQLFGDVKTVQIDLSHNGDFGFIAELTIGLGNRYNGMYANSYCYKSRQFEFGDSSEIVNGQAYLRFSHASSWLIAIENSPVLEDVSSGAAARSSDTPIDMSNSTSGIKLPDFVDEKKFKLSNKKRRYRILKKRRLDDLVFVF